MLLGYEIPKEISGEQWNQKTEKLIITGKWLIYISECICNMWKTQLLLFHLANGSLALTMHLMQFQALGIQKETRQRLFSSEAVQAGRGKYQILFPEITINHDDCPTKVTQRAEIRFMIQRRLL